MDMTNPRLQLSDLTDYQFTTSLAQQYNTYTTSQTASQPGNYFQSLPQNGTRASALRSPQHLQLQSQSQSRSSISQNQNPAHDYGIQALYQRPSNSEASRTFNTASRETSLPNRASIGNGELRQNHLASLNNTTTSSDISNGINQQSGKVENLKDPTIFVPPHLLAPMKPNPPSLKQWREKFFNIDEPLLLTSEQYLTYFPHVDNVYSHRSTQKYKKKPFVSHYWDCRLKGRPTGTPMNKAKKADAPGMDKEPKKRKRKARERDLCDVKIKVTEYFGTEELEALRKLGLSPETGANDDPDASDLNFVLGGQRNRMETNDSTFGVLEPTQNYPPGHPGAGGKKWYLVQRVSNTDKDGEEIEGRNLDHKHSLEDSDQIKKNSVQRWLLAQAKEKKKAAKAAESQSILQDEDGSDPDDHTTQTSAESPPSRLHATGSALQTLHTHLEPTSNNLTFYGCSFCPFSQRVWIALELTGIPYQYVEVTERNTVWTDQSLECRMNFPGLMDINPDGRVPCLKHNNFAVWDNIIMMEYLEDLALGHSLFAPAIGSAQLKAHSRLWVDFIDRRILPVFYTLLLLPGGDGTAHSQVENNVHGSEPQQVLGYTFLPSQNQCDPSTLPPEIMAAGHPDSQPSTMVQSLIATLHTRITTLVNASHRTGPFFLGPTLSYVDIAFAPWIIRLSRVLSYYRGFPRPEVNTRWKEWCDAIENNHIVKRTVSEEVNYRDIYSGSAGGEQGWHYDSRGRLDWEDARSRNVIFPEIKFARRVVESEGLGMSCGTWGKVAGAV